MSDVAQRDDVDQQAAADQQDVDVPPVEAALLEVQPPGTVLYPENDALRAALSNGMPAGNAQDVPPGTDTIASALTEQAYPAGPEGQQQKTGSSKPEFAKVAALSRGSEDVDR